MDKMKCETESGVERNVDRIAAMFPQVVTEVKGEDGKITRAVKWDVLKELLSGEYVEGGECYDFTWPGKRAAIAEAARPIRKTLRPCKAESKDWDTTENLYIEGDNLEVLKLLQESYLGKVKMIYIDPPYNTGNDLIYEDDFKVGNGEYADATEEVVEDAETGETVRMFRNTESNGRFHSDWCSMIYSRLQIARDLLTDDGIIFISIGDDELENLKKICHDIFGANNFIGQINIITGANQSGEGVLLQKNVEYCLVYAKQILSAKIIRVDKTEESWRNLNDAPTPLETRPDMGYTIYYNPQTGDMQPEFDYDKDSISTNQLNLVYTDNTDRLNSGYLPIRPGMRNGLLHRWRWGKDTFEERKKEIKMFPSGDSYTPKFQQSGFNAPQNTQHFSGGASDLKKIFGDQIPFDYPKGVAFIEYLCKLGLGANDVVLDFFSGSATTAHAVMKLNTEDGGRRKFIMAQIPQKLDGKTQAGKNAIAFCKEHGMEENLCSIGKERIRRAGEKIKEEAGLAAADLDVGFRVFKVADSNMKDVYFSAADYSQDMIDRLVSNIKEDRTDLDLLYGCLLEWGVELSLPHTSEKIDGVTVHTVNGGDLIACFDPNIPESAIRTIAKRQPLRAVFRDSSFASAPQKINVEEIFKLLSPTTTIKVI